MYSGNSGIQVVPDFVDQVLEAHEVWRDALTHRRRGVVGEQGAYLPVVEELHVNAAGTGPVRDTDASLRGGRHPRRFRTLPELGEKPFRGFPRQLRRRGGVIPIPP